MCTYVTETLQVGGSAKSGSQWKSAGKASVYFDHPVHAPYEHSLNIDLFDASDELNRLVGLELSEETACELAETILCVLDKAAVELGTLH